MPKNLQNNLFDKIIDEENLDKAYRKALKGKSKYKNETILFSNDETVNLRDLRQSLIDETYQFEGYIRFPVYEPKERIVDAPHFKDKIVQLAINNILKEIYNPKFIHDSFACIDERGTHKCVDRIQHFMKQANRQYGDDAFIVKVDMKKYFYSIDRDILKNLLPKSIICEKTLRLIFKIIDSADIIDSLGLPLGNTLSQICANIYLNELDQYCKRRLSIKYYVRYMDDAILIMPTKEEASLTLELIKQFAKDRLNLILNENKSKIFPINQGINVVGFKIYATHRLLRNDSKKKIKRKVKAMPKLICEGRLTIEKAEQMLNSWLGHAKHSDSYNFIKSLMKKNNFLYLECNGDKRKLKINEKKLKEVYNKRE